MVVAPLALALLNAPMRPLPAITATHLRPRARIDMLDAAIVADAAQCLSDTCGGAMTGPMANTDPHTMANLLPDLLHTTVISAVGLAGAYVTRGAEGADMPPPPDGPRVRRQRRADRADQYDYGFDYEDLDAYEYDSPPPRRRLRDSSAWDER